MQTEFFYGRDKLTVQTASLLAQKKIKGSLHQDVINRINESQRHVQRMADTGKTVYGITTGFGILANTKISEEDTATLQYKILQSHSVGVGDPVAEDLARLMMITKLHALAQGFSGVQLSTVERILWHLEKDVIPVVPEKGSVGACTLVMSISRAISTLMGSPTPTLWLCKILCCKMRVSSSDTGLLASTPKPVLMP